MPWVVGIDEAGYGPNLGPLVQAAVAVGLPDDDLAGWDALKPAVRRARGKDDGRLLIDDSKKVYARGGLAALERGVMAALILMEPTVGDVLRRSTIYGVGVRDVLAGEPWYDAAEPTPVEADGADVFAAFEWFTAALPDGYKIGTPQAIVVPTSRFNQIVDESGSKAAVPARGLVELMTVTLDHLSQSADPVLFRCDKLGGRNFYAALVQQAFPDGWVVAEVESADESRYRVERLDRPVSISFRPRADGDSVAVALASMLCKYLREVCMRQFNRFWATHVPGIQPTAGYPVDAKRFYAEIRPAMRKLGLTEDRVWRKK
jgi:ribonuclease HII